MIVPIGTATGTLDVSDVSATFFTSGTIAYGPTGSAQYSVPKATRLGPLYAASVWVGGTVGGEFRVAGATYGQGGTDNDYFEFWPGPLNEDGTLPNPDDCSAYDRIWVVSVTDLADYEASGTASADLAEWPVGLGAPTVDAAGNRVEPTSRDQVVALEAGERPAIVGSQTAFWVMNDVGDLHRTTGSDPLGIEVAVTAFSIASDTLALDRATFYRYAITNRNSQPIEDARLSLWADPDLGNAGDDFIGVDTTRSMAYVYNADELDDGQYGQNPPAWGVDVLGGITDSGQRGLTSFVYFVGGDANRGDPGDLEEYRNIMRGVWADGTPMTAFGSGYATSGEVTTFVFPGDPVTQSFWSEENNGSGRNVAADRRFALSTGPGTIAPGETRTVDLGFLFARATDRLASVTDLRAASDLVQEMYGAGTLFRTRPVPVRAVVTAAPALLSPADGAGPFEEEVTLTWEAVDLAESYDLEVSASASFEDPLIEVNQLSTSWTGIPQAYPDTAIYWRVRGRSRGGAGPYSEVRSFDYAGALSQISFVGIVEQTGPGGVDPCGENAQSTNGCPPEGEPYGLSQPGNYVYFSHNSTGEYLMYYNGPVGSAESVGWYAPNDYELRWVSPDEGAYASYAFGTGRVIRVPFQIWDIGDTPLGEPNDPSDDVQMVPALLADAGDDAASECTFAFNGPATLEDIGISGLSTQRIYAYYPVDNDYHAYAAAASAIVDAAGGCADYDEDVDLLIDYARGRPIQRDVIIDASGARAGSSDFSFLEGTVIRYYTRAPEATTVDEAPPMSAAVALWDPFPNPAARVASVAYDVPRTGPVQLAVYDVLGREVAVLVDGAQPIGPGEARLDASRLAAGVYVVVLTTPAGRATRTFTVAR